MSAPLAGVRILDLTHFVAGPWCTMMLADLGAEVIKLEPPSGEIGRGMGGVYAAGESAIFLGFNRGKRSISLDLKQPEGLAAAQKLAEQADIVVQNFRPGTAERLGIGAADLRARNPQLIYCTVSAFGPDGPYATRPANDPVIQALSGSMAATGPPEGRPVRMGVSLPDLAAGVLAAIGIMAALYRRTDSGTGCTVDLNLLDAQLYAQTDLITSAALSDDATTAMAGTSSDDSAVGGAGPALKQHPEAVPAAIRGAYVCADGLSLWLDSDPTRPINDALRLGAASSGGSGPSREKVAAQILTQPRDYWLNLLGQAGAYAFPILELFEVLPDPSPRTLEVDHPTIGPLRQNCTPVTSDPPWPIVHIAPPRLGEHTRDVLQELGFSDSEVDRMAGQGTVLDGSPHPKRSHDRVTDEHAEEQP